MERSTNSLKKARSKPSAKVKLELPSHWPRFTTPEYYAWMMARMPADAIPADWSKHQPHNSYGPLFWYQDELQSCVSCGVQFTFTKEEQRTWYEEYRVPIYAFANRCAECRQARRQAKLNQREHMEAMALRAPHPHEAFFKRRA
jgi:hypothetical protein